MPFMDLLHKRILIALFRLTEADRSANVSLLAQELGCSRRDIACALSALDMLGLVRAERVRLTFLGLTRALGLEAKARRRRTRLAA